MTRKTNDAGIALIKEFEGLRLEAYQDPVGVWTVGYGHTDAAGAPKVTRGMKITAAEADAILRRDLGQYERAVESAVTVPLTEDQFSALVSFTFNLGAGNLRKSTLLQKLNKGDYAGAAAQFQLWNKAGGKVMNGLTRRREAERALFEKGMTRKHDAPVTSEKPGPFATILSLLARIFGGRK